MTIFFDGIVLKTDSDQKLSDRLFIRCHPFQEILFQIRIKTGVDSVGSTNVSLLQRQTHLVIRILIHIFMEW